MSIAKRFTRSVSIGITLSILFLQPGNLLAGTACPEIIGATNDVITGDFDGDGRADMAAIGDAKIVIVFGDSGARPTRLGGTIVTGVTFGDLAAGDWNGDGSLDLVAASGNGNYLRVLLGDGTGAFTYGGIFEATGPGRMAAGDFDGDGHLDIAFRSGTTGIRAVYGDGAGGFGPEQVVLNASETVYDLAAGDLNGDGRSDLAVVVNNFPDGNVRTLDVFLGTAAGSFTSLPAQDLTETPFAVALGDMNEDGLLDAVVGGTATVVHLGHGDGSLEVSSSPMASGRSGGRIRVGDVDGDGHLDAVSVVGPVLEFITCPDNLVQFFHGGGDGSLATPQIIQTRNIMSLSLGDVNQDGYMDAVRVICGSLIVHLGSPSGLQTLTNPARAFVIKNSDVIRLNSNKSAWCVHIEGVNGSIDFDHEFPTNLVLVSEGTGSQSTAPYINKQTAVLGDADGNGISDAEVGSPGTELEFAL